MTKKKPRNITPYTTNVASIGFGGYTEPLESVLDKFFDSEAGSNTSERILQAIAAYDMAVKTNPTRQRAKKQRDDWRELIESMKELNQRLHPFYIPPPMLDTARSAYTKHAGGKPTLNEEIRDLLLRLLHLQKIFEATIIPTPSWTNPGKPERDILVRELENIFDDLTRDGYSASAHAADNDPPVPTEAEKHRDRKNFVQEVFEVFHLPLPPL